jgi:ABC-type dipeptide/oligopeptide/nickel transport system ATPase component
MYHRLTFIRIRTPTRPRILIRTTRILDTTTQGMRILTVTAELGLASVMAIAADMGTIIEAHPRIAVDMESSDMEAVAAAVAAKSNPAWAR